MCTGDFIYKVSSQSPTRHFIIHSRKALLNGISPADNRKIPPLKYAVCNSLIIQQGFMTMKQVKFLYIPT